MPFPYYCLHLPNLKLEDMKNLNYNMYNRAVDADSTTATRTITVTVTTAGPPNDHAPVFHAFSGPFKVLTDASIGMALSHSK